MLDKKDAQWWVLEVEKHPQSAADLIRMLADRLAFLDKQNEELRGELTALRRKQRGEAAQSEGTALQQRIQELERALRQNGIGQRLLVYAADRIEANLPLDGSQNVEREVPGDVALLSCDPAARLFIITTESQVFSLTVGDLPLPENGPAMLGNPRNVAAILDQAAFERCRFLTLLSRSGYVYSVLAGTINQIARRQDRLIRNLIPGDPIVAAIPSHNVDLFAVSQKGRWTRFPQKTIAGSGSLVMELPKGDGLVGVVSLAADTNLTFLTTDGRLLVQSTEGLATRKAPGTSSGMLFKNQSIFGVTSSDDLVILTRLGKVLCIQTKQLPFKAQTDAGTPIPGLSTEDSVLAFAAR
jgi:DNA gyrase/topoisomerase IV subunit A